ncbi:MAG TPA: hypothetical protein EYF95_00260 [Flavobacteriales bacterium]|nr:hypothetical protein [Flavobacteriales bacterium]
MTNEDYCQNCEGSGKDIENVCPKCQENEAHSECVINIVEVPCLHCDWEGYVRVCGELDGDY